MPADPAVILQIEGVVRRFGKFTAVDVEHLEIQRGSITSLIGPNGAGKSTLFNVLSGFMPASLGRWVFDGTQITRMPAHRISDLGMVRTFQHTALAPRLTVLENVMLGARRASGETLLAAAWPPGWKAAERRLREQGDSALELFGLSHLRDAPAGILSGGQRKLLELARALMAAPRLLMLDEPMAGVNPALRDSLLEHIVDFNRRGTTVLLIEHDMELVRRISQHVICMAEGRVIARGTAAAVAVDPAVVDAYLGAKRATPPSAPAPAAAAAHGARALGVHELVAGYLPDVDVLRGCSLELYAGEIVGIFGPNGAGKSTLLKAVFGLAQRRAGRITHTGEDITSLRGHQLVARGIGYVPQLENVFAQLTVRENLQTGVFLAPDRWEGGVRYVTDLFPVLKNLMHKRAGDLSGGERQVVALARALMLKPSILLLDEPSAGLSPIMQEQVFQFIARIRAEGIAILIVEQNARRCLEVCDRGYILDQGQNVYSGTGHALLHDPRVEELYLGVRPAQPGQPQPGVPGAQDLSTNHGEIHVAPAPCPIPH